ncbi:hypothetical protein RHMOL_Rhmol11G0099000 [Rhododendron molle]|uniref:Uncharacterized protein n=1 Tax=Rhododendron molle TaxID=49168 RepID=A0ACC0LQM4_RHOML|nr:hypothetical protein RHMOL_Rhmol11G0099000 [Rhododendron molle]
MLEWIRSYLVNRRVLRREWIRKWTDPLLSNIYTKLENNKANCYEYIADWCGELNFQVRCPYGQYTVDLRAMTCTCRKWDLCGIPCTHAIAAIQNRKHDAESYINACYSKENYARAYHTLIMPINGKDMWPKTGFTPVLPPLEKRKLGRPKMDRRIDPSEYISKKDKNKLRRLGQNSVFCRKCGKHGHNRRTCTHESGAESNVDEGGVGSIDGVEPNVGNGGVQSNVGSVQSSAGDGSSSSGVGRGRGKGTTTVVGRGRGRGRSRGKGTSTGIGRERETTSELERGTTSELGRGTISVQGRRSTNEQRRGRGTTNGLGSQISEDTGVECQFQATMVHTRGGGTTFLGRGGRIQWRGHEVNVPSNYAQATKSSQTAVGSNKSTAKCIFKSQKFGNLAAI